MFIKLVSIWLNSAGEKIKVWQTASSGYSYEIERKHNKSTFFGSYDKLKKTLLKDGFKETTHEFNSEKFVDNVISEALKPGEKVEIPKTIKMKLSPDAAAALKMTADTQKEKKEIEAALKKHEQEYKKLNALLNKVRLKQDQLEIKQKKLNAVPSKSDFKYFSLIEDVCSDFIKDMKKAGGFLYRGMSSGGDVVYGKSHENRKTKDTKSDVQKLFDEYLKITGFKALRSNSIFVSPRYNQAERYGSEVYIIFPRNGYSFTWSEEESDWIPSMSELTQVNLPHDVPILWRVQDRLYDIASALKPADLHNTTFHIDIDRYDNRDEWMKEQARLVDILKTIPEVEALSKEAQAAADQLDKDRGYTEKNVKEIGNIFKKFYDIEKKVGAMLDMWDRKGASRSTVDALIKFSETDYKEPTTKEKAEMFVKRSKIQTGDMVKAIKSDNEIYIHGEYIAFKDEIFRKKLQKYFKINNINY